MARVTHTNNQLVLATKKAGNAKTERNKKKDTERGFWNVVYQKKVNQGCYNIFSCQCAFDQAADLAQQQKRGM